METVPKASLYDRLGGTEGIDAIAAAVVQRHVKNPLIGRHFADSDLPKVTRDVADFFNMGSGGPAVYGGRDMPTAHEGMKLTEADLCSAIDDVLAVLDERGVDGATRNEVLGILYSFKGEVLHR